MALLDWNRQHNSNAKRQIQNIKQELRELQRSGKDDKGERRRELRGKLAEAYRKEEVF